MINFDQEKLEAAIVQQAADNILSNERDLSARVGAEVKKRVDAIFAKSAESQIETAINAAIGDALDRPYCRVDSFGQKVGEETTLKSQLVKAVDSYWTARVSPSNGMPITNTYDKHVSRAEYVMMSVCAADFSAHMKGHMLNITGALKDGFRNQIAVLMDKMLSDLFHVKSLQDQGQVEKPY